MNVSQYPSDIMAEGENQVSDLMWRALRSALPLCLQRTTCMISGTTSLPTARMASMPSAIVRRSKPSGPRLCKGRTPYSIAVRREL